MHFREWFNYDTRRLSLPPAIASFEMFFFPCRTKRMIVDVLNVQAGENLTEILETPASDEQVRVVYDHYLIC